MPSLQSLPKALDFDDYPLTLNSKSVETYMHLPNDTLYIISQYIKRFRDYCQDSFISFKTTLGTGDSYQGSYIWDFQSEVELGSVPGTRETKRQNNTVFRNLQLTQ